MSVKQTNQICYSPPMAVSKFFWLKCVGTLPISVNLIVPLLFNNIFSMPHVTLNIIVVVHSCD